MVPAHNLPGAVRFNEAITRGTRGALTRPEIKPDDVAVLQYTGGTTGVSKGAVLLHRNVIANVLQSEAWNQPAMSKVPAGEQSTGVCALPLYHIFAFTVGMMLSMRTGAKLILIPNPRDLPAVLKELAKHTFHTFPAVNTLFNGLANHPDFNSVNWSNLKVSVGGGMAVQAAVAKLWLEKTGCPICEGYGLSETSPSASCNYFKIVDRKKDMVLVSGFNVYPNEVEDVVAGMDGVMECAVVGVPDDKTGEAVKLVIVRKNPELNEAQVREFCRANLTGYKQPKVIEFRTELPKTPVGKILRRELRDRK
jgi:acyl-CoA synthetase (AMP-forming)/AMP-acid ligase II